MTNVPFDYKFGNIEFISELTSAKDYFASKKIERKEGESGYFICVHKKL